MTDTATLDEARGYAETTWARFTQDRNLRATLAWTGEEKTPDGSLLISARLHGREAAYALLRFSAGYPLVLGAPGDQRPQADYSDPDRVACVWRKSGVWIELWAPADAVGQTKPKPEPAPSLSLSASVASALRGLGGRLPHTRRNKEATTA